MSDRLEMRDICKSFGGVRALDHVHFNALAGEVHALMGENGAGKSTLMKILSGAYTKDEGDILIEGKEVHITSPKIARDYGISIIYQEFALAQDLTVAENIFIDNMASGKRTIDWKDLYKKAGDLLEQLGFGAINAKEKIGNLSVAHQQVVEICKSLSRNSNILVFDEPTAVLTSDEVEQLFKLIKKLKESGVCIIYISHRLEEIFEISDRITVMKDGQYVGTVMTSEIGNEELVTMMVGRKLEEIYPPRHAEIGDVMLRVENICSGKAVQNVSFEVRSGEILGINGLIGAGRTEMMQAIFGAAKCDSGKIYVQGSEVSIDSPIKALRSGIGMLTEDRKRTGILLNMPIRYNVTIPILKELSNKAGVINKSKEDEVVDGLVEKLRIKIGSVEDNASSLSGGNQQKVALAKWLGSGCKILLLDEPTRGVDIGGRSRYTA